jgi:hypothetical protein
MVDERFLSDYYPAMRNAPKPEEVAKVVLESILLNMRSLKKLLLTVPAIDDITIKLVKRMK